jgi:hypothetical protein
MGAKEETAYTTALIAHVRRLNGYAWHVHGSALQEAGQPDLDGFIPSEIGGIPFKVEVKTPTGKPTELQIVRMRVFHRSGAYMVGVCVTPEDFDRLTEAYIRSVVELRDLWGVLQEMGIPDPYYIYHTKGLLDV